VTPRRTKEVELLGHTLTLAEHIARDAKDLETFWEKHKADPMALTQATLASVGFALEINVQRIPKWRVLKRARMRKLISRDNLYANLTGSQLGELLQEVMRLNDPEYDNKKKIASEQPTGS
jgi:hypothetical protein